MRLPDAVAHAIVAHAQRTAPDECCGLLIGTSVQILEAVEATNVAGDRRRRYEVDPRDHIRAIRSARNRHLQVVGAYHSHPGSPPVPSDTDAALAFSEFLWLIVGLGDAGPEIRAWRWTGGNFVPVALVRVREGEG